MRQTDIVVVGAGAAGSAAAAMLGRAGVDTLLIDPHVPYPADFRCEKLDASQIRLLRATGLADAVAPIATPIPQIWVSRFGRLVERRRSEQFGLAYGDLVNALRGAVGGTAHFLQGKVTGIATGPDRQTVTLADGEPVSARLVVLASGLNHALRQSLGIVRNSLSPNHSVTIGFDLVPVGRRSFDFPALTIFPEHARDRMAYLSLFPLGDSLRANLFTYRDPRDPWFRRLREVPEAAILEAFPSLARFAGRFAVVGEVKIRPVDLVSVSHFRREGIVLVGDAFGTSCPAAGTGLNKVLTDVECLCREHIPRWLATPGMDETKIGAFYDDPVKQSADRASLAKAYRLRAISTGLSLPWLAQRWARFLFQAGHGLVGGVADRLRRRGAASAPNRPAY